MNIIVVDDEQYALEALKAAVEEVLPDSSISCFDDSEAALEYAKTCCVDTAFLDIEMGGLNGLQLAKQLKDIAAARNGGKTSIIFVTGYSQYAIDAFALRANGYILKPFTVKAVREAIEHLQPEGSRAEVSASENKLRVQTFGNFEVFARGKLLKFNRVKTKELFAYLVSRKGALCSNNEIAAVIWENKEDSLSLQTQFRKLVADLTEKLDEAGMGDVLIKERGYLAVVSDKLSCDFYDFCAGLNVNNYMGEFMNQYSWAELTNTYLNQIFSTKK